MRANQNKYKQLVSRIAQIQWQTTLMIYWTVNNLVLLFIRVSNHMYVIGVLEEFEQPQAAAVVEEEQAKEHTTAAAETVGGGDVDMEQQLNGLLEQLARSDFANNSQVGNMPSDKGTFVIFVLDCC
jgi:hypothetical protein